MVDPLDGTTNYLYGLPGVGGERRARGRARAASLGVVLDPVRGEMFSAVRGRGRAAERRADRGRAAATASTTALVATGFGYEAERRERQAAGARRGVLPRVRDIRRAGAAALDLCLVACGRVDGYYERGLEPWDWAAGSVVVREAGGEVRALPGEPAGLVAASPGIAEGLAELVA